MTPQPQSKSSPWVCRWDKNGNESNVNSMVVRVVKDGDRRGGKRKGAGRKPRPDSRNVPKSIKVSQQMADYLTQRGTGIIEDALRKTKDFKDWAKSQRL